MTETETHRGKQANQKLKPYIVLQLLLKESDENHSVSANSIVDALKERGIYAERRSIYRDIDEINKATWMIENDATIQEAEEVIAADDCDNEKLVVYDKSQKGFYVRQRHFDLNDIRLLAECVYSSKFIAEGQSKRLVDVVSEFVSEYQADIIKHDALLTDRVKTDNRNVLNSIDCINAAMSRRRDGIPHEPEKIAFQYMKYSVNDVRQRVERRHGLKYVVSPYKLLINDGNYYLLAFDDSAKAMRTYRVDRMKAVELTSELREGREVFEKIDLSTYTKRVFSMFGGKEERVSIRFINPLLDAVVDRFGNNKYEVQYSKTDDSHFTVSTRVEISDQFYGWLLGFGKKAKLIGSEAAVSQFKAYLDKVKEMYES